uniref:Uncharacterized protein n=1 Tax=Cacopsylla melanoneura TaxID=428564 RepID=A0A8D9EHZ0_9HEMI
MSNRLVRLPSVSRVSCPVSSTSGTKPIVFRNISAVIKSSTVSMEPMRLIAIFANAHREISSAIHRTAFVFPRRRNATATLTVATTRTRRTVVPRRDPALAALPVNLTSSDVLTDRSVSTPS